MNLRIALRLQKMLRTRHASGRTASQRRAAALALRWIQASLADEFDILWRLAVLEGAANVPAGAWTRMGRRGLTKARDTFSAEALNPAWLSDKNSGMYNILKAKAEAAIRSYKVTFIEADDILTNMIAGLGVNLDVVGSKPVHSAGKTFAAGILSGKETPRTIAAGPLSKYVEQRVSNMKKKVRHEQQMPVDEDGMELDFAAPDDTADFSDVREVLAEVVFHQLNHPLSKKIRGLMRDTWHDSPPMLLWLDTIENERRFPTGKEIAEKSGISPPAFTARHWRPRWQKFFKVFWSRPRLLDEIERFLAKQGLRWEMVKPTGSEMDSFLKTRSDRPRLGSSDFILNLLGRFD